jgi:quaternary ammonium compound-resistance protein SugE
VAWLLLALSGLLEVAWAISMKYAEGYTRPG